MSNLRYLEIDSTYRNRIEDREPSNFTVKISQSGTKNILNSNDPVSNEAPILILNNTLYTTTATTPGNIHPSSTNNQSSFIVKFIKTFLEHTDGYYVGSTIKISTYTKRITNWSFLSSNSTHDFFYITISQELPSTENTITGNQTVNFINTTDILNNYIFLPLFSIY